MSLLADLKERWRQEKEPSPPSQGSEDRDDQETTTAVIPLSHASSEHSESSNLPSSDIPLSPPIVQTENDDAARTESGSSTAVQVDPAGVDPAAAADPAGDAALEVSGGQQHDLNPDRDAGKTAQGQKVKAIVSWALNESVQCQRCQHQWTPRTPDLPKQCPHCHSNYWTQPFKTPPLRPPKHKLEQWAFNRKIANLRFRARALNHELIDSKELAELWQRLREAELRASQRGSPFSEPSPGNPLPKSESRAQRGRKGLAASSAPCVIPPPPGMGAEDDDEA